MSLSREYKKVLTVANKAVDEWFLMKQESDKKPYKRDKVVTEDAVLALTREYIPSVEGVNVMVIGERVKIKIELYLDRRYIVPQRHIIIKHGDKLAPNPIVKGKSFNRGTHRKTIKTHIRTALIKLAKQQPQL